VQYPIAAPAPATDDLDVPRLILRDGSAATVRIAGPADREELGRFFHRLSPNSKRQRFLAAGDPPDAVINQFSAPADPERALTLVAARRVGADDQIVAVASYQAAGPTMAEVAFTVDEDFHGKGLATLLLERLAGYAAAQGFERFQATTFADNSAMLDVFRDSGFEMRSTASAGCVELELSLVPSVEGVDAAERRRRLATIASMTPLVAPRAVAVIGAAHDRVNVGGQILRAIVAGGFTGAIHVVHPQAPVIEGFSAVRSARDLPPGVDLAVVAVPHASVLPVVDDCAAAGIKSLVVISAGFAESAGNGRTLQAQLVDRVRSHGMRMVGPNCMGLLNTAAAVRLNASFSPVVPPAGRVAFSSQSGALGIALLGLARARHVGISQFVSIGNKADVSSNDLLEYWESDPGTSVILLYLESFGNPRRFGRIARRVARSKPIVAVKAGRTQAGTRAAGSHTAALAASDDAVDALFHQSGVIRAETIDELFDIAALLDAQPLPTGPRVAVITNAGGPGILVADACETAGLKVSELPASALDGLKGFLPAAASVRNPVDMLASAGADDYRRAIAQVLATSEVDALVVVFTPIDTSKNEAILDGIRAGIASARVGGARQPILACLMSEELAARLECGGEQVPVYRFPENAVRALGKATAYARWRSEPAGRFWNFDDIHAGEARAICRQALTERPAGWLTPDEASRVLGAYGVPLVHGVVAHLPDEAAAIAETMGFPVVAKVSSRAIQHKSDIGGVRLNLRSAEDVRKAFAELLANAKRVAADDVDGVLIQPMVAGLETIVGVAQDPLFGPLVGFGIGGVDVEAFGDVRFRVAPLTDRDGQELLNEIRGARLLRAYRGRPAVDAAALHELLLRISRLVEDIHEITELDLNPVMARPAGQGAVVVDARIRVEKHVTKG
jgi:acetyl coenzyme A synthetase (ADP forming)-like protein